MTADGHGIDTGEPHLVAAVNELGAMACAVRPDWPPADVTAALVDARVCGMTFAQTLLGLSRLIVDLSAQPRELVPLGEAPRTVHKPAVLKRHAGELEQARQACAEASAKRRTDEGDPA